MRFMHNGDNDVT